ncbi:hypothetical protein [Paracoccus tegillarcae]|nr:hypothetical protein [Paracoccus tegillarcae]
MSDAAIGDLAKSLHKNGVTAEDIASADAMADDDLSPDSDDVPCKACQEDICKALKKQSARNKDEQEKAQLAAATYDPNAPLPEGYRRATAADLQKMGLSDGAGTNILVLSDEPDFHAEAFVKTDPVSRAESYVVGFKGTEMLSGSDWGTNFGQGLGRKTAYYMQANSIGEKLRGGGVSPISFVGHSLGGGLAATASGASGLPAQTFNAAGLSGNTLDDLSLANSDLIKNTSVTGDILTGVQNRTIAPDAFGVSRSIADVKAANYSRGAWTGNTYNSGIENNAKSGV